MKTDNPDHARWTSPGALSFWRTSFALALLMTMATTRAADVDFLWARQAGAASYDEGRSIAVDKAGNCYVTGYFQGNATFGGTSLSAYTNHLGGLLNGVFLAKYDSIGNLNWVRQFGPGQGLALAVDTNNALYFAGDFTDTASFGNTNLIGDRMDIFVAKCDAAGNVLWVRQAGGPSDDQAFGIAVSRSGNVYVTGFYQAHAGAVTFGTITLTNEGGTGSFVAKYDGTGNIMWVRHAAGAAWSNAQGKSLAVDDAENVLVTGLFSGTVTFGTSNLSSSPGGYDVFASKYDANGNLLWVRQAGGDGGQNVGHGIGVDSSGAAYVVGSGVQGITFGGTMLGNTNWQGGFIVKYDSDGIVQWTRNTPAVRGVAVDSRGHSFVTGGFQSQATFGATNINSTGTVDGFIAAHDSDGGSLWALNAGGQRSYVYANSIAADSDGVCYATGSFAGADARFGNTVVTNDINDPNVFIAQAGAVAPRVVTQPLSQHVLVGTLVELNLLVFGSLPLSYQWKHNGTNIPWATNSSLQITNVSLSDNGAYTASVRNKSGATTSEPATVTTAFAFVFGNGERLRDTQHIFFRSVEIEIQSAYTTGSVFYTLDGSAPTATSRRYTGPFNVEHNAVLRALVYSPDFATSGESAQLTIGIVPAYVLSTATTGGGTVSLAPAVGPYVSNTVVNASASASSGWTFLQWLGDASGTNTHATITMTRDKSVQAVFGTQLSTMSVGMGSVVVSPRARYYPFGSALQLAAVPGAGQYLVLWGGTASGNTNPLSFDVTAANPSVSALFGALNPGKYAVTVVSEGNGRAVVNPRSSYYTTGQMITLQAVPEEGQEFSGWGGDATGSDNPLILAVNQSKIITATFTKRPWLSAASPLAGWTPDGFRFLLTGEFGAVFRIFGTASVTEWLPLGEVTNHFGTSQFADLAVTNAPYHFYRAVRLDP